MPPTWAVAPSGSDRPRDVRSAVMSHSLCEAAAVVEDAGTFSQTQLPASQPVLKAAWKL